MQNMETQAYDAEGLAQAWGHGLASGSTLQGATLEAGKLVKEVEETIPETQVVLTPPCTPKKKLPMPPSPVEPEKGSIEKLDFMQDAQVPLEATPTPTKLDEAPQLHNTPAAEEEDPPFDQADNTLTAQDNTSAPEKPASVLLDPALQLNNTRAAEKEDPTPDQADNTLTAQDSSLQSKPEEVSVAPPNDDESSSNLLKVAEAASAALDAAKQALSNEPDDAVPVPLRVEQFEVRNASGARGGRGRGGRGRGRSGGGKGRGRGKKVADRPEGPENSEPIEVSTDMEDPEGANHEPSEEGKPKAKGKAKAKAKGKAKAQPKGKAQPKAKGHPKAKAKGKAKAMPQAQEAQHGMQPQPEEEPLFRGGVDREAVAKFFSLKPADLEPRNPDRPAKPGRAKRTGPTATFARRVKPKTNPAEARFTAIRDVFRDEVSKKLEELGQGKCAYEERVVLLFLCCL